MKVDFAKFTDLIIRKGERDGKTGLQLLFIYSRSSATKLKENVSSSNF